MESRYRQVLWQLGAPLGPLGPRAPGPWPEGAFCCPRPMDAPGEMVDARRTRGQGPCHGSASVAFGSSALTNGTPSRGL
eukprot:8808203-Alexandrium_andersonii.AAC.1